MIVENKYLYVCCIWLSDIWSVVNSAFLSSHYRKSINILNDYGNYRSILVNLWLDIIDTDIEKHLFRFIHLTNTYQLY